MNEQNLKFIKDTMKYLGFDEKMGEALEKNISEKKPAFQLGSSAEYHNQKMGLVLHFRMGEQHEMYFFNKYDAILKNEKVLNNDRVQTFYINKNQGITVKEAFNLLNGRAVNTDLTTKDGQKYNAWVELDFKQREENGNYKVKQYHQNYGYDIEKTLLKYPIKEMGDEKMKVDLIRSLEKGNLQRVNMAIGERSATMFIQANPQFKDITIYDAQLKEVMSNAVRRDIKPEMNSRENHQMEKQTIRQPAADSGDDEEPGLKKKRIQNKNRLGV